MTNNKINLNIFPVIIYVNIEKYKSSILKNNKKKSGVYCIKNLITGKIYVGSAIDISKRFNNYLKPSYLKSKKSNSIIYNTLLKYGYSNFSLGILEYTYLSMVLNIEQYYIDLLNPEYNILKTAGSRLGSKHSKEAKAKMKANYIISSSLRKTNHLLATGHVTTILNKKNNETKIYGSINAAAKDIGTSHNLLLKYINTNKLYKGIYLIKKVKQNV